MDSPHVAPSPLDAPDRPAPADSLGGAAPADSLANAADTLTVAQRKALLKEAAKRAKAEEKAAAAKEKKKKLDEIAARRKEKMTARLLEQKEREEARLTARRLKAESKLKARQARATRKGRMIQIDSTALRELDSLIVLNMAEQDSLLNLLISFLPMIILFWFVNRWASKKMQEMGGAGGNAMLFGGKSGAKQYVVDDETGIKFNDVAGEDEAKESLQEIVDFLNNPKKYEEIGAKMPKGVLLVGPPGTGKTLLARAVAGEAGVPFFSIAGSEFVEMFVGMGASKVRDLFKQAGEKAPCIVFIDEIDTIGKKRDGGANLGGNDEREQTLNQLLTEMDGFDATKGVVILAATNRPESLDPALTRPGRFDRRVPVELPDLKGRESILRLHAKKVKLGPDCDFGVVARMTPGASGAELANIVNEAALCAVRHRRKAVTQFDLQEAVDTILAGAQKKNKILNNKEKCIVSYHEVGHALVAALQTNSAPVQKITIVPRTSGALGFTMQVEDGDHTLMTKEEILNKIATLTGGRAAEELIFHSITTGASNDIEQATKLARALVTRYGMTEDFDMVALETVNNAYLGGDASLACSEQTAAQVDAKVVEIVQAEHKKAYQLLADNKRKLDEIAQYLYEKETISGEEFMRILNAQPQLPAGPSADSTNQAQ